MRSATDSEHQEGQSLGRVLDVLGLFSADSAELSLTVIAERLGWPAPTAHRVTATLVERGFLTRDRGTKLFRLGLGVVRLVAPMLTSFHLPELAGPHLQSLSADTGETVNLAILDGAEVLYVASYPGTFRLRAEATPGAHLSAHCTALGKCLLAQLDPQDARRRLGPGPYREMTPKTARTWDELAPRLDAARTEGYAISIGEYEEGLLSCAVPVQAEGGMVAAVNVAAPAMRISSEALAGVILGKLQAAAAAIDRARAGHVGAP
jgi:IclR family transcriptional regulator, acetate operon repressor